MKLFNWLKMERKDRPNNPIWTNLRPRSEAQIKDIKTSSVLHQHRIDNLNEELEKLSDSLCALEIIEDSPRATKTKQADIIVEECLCLGTRLT